MSQSKLSALGQAMRNMMKGDAMSAAFKAAPKAVSGLEVPLSHAAPALSQAEHASRFNELQSFMPRGKFSGDNTMTNYEQGVKTALAQMGFKVAGDEDGVTVHDGPPSTAKSEAKPEHKGPPPAVAEGAEAGAETGAAAGAQAAEGQMDDQAIEAALAQLSPEELMQLLEQLPPEEVEAAMQALQGGAGSPSPTLPGGQGLGMLPPGGQPGTPCPPAEEAAPAMPPHPDGGAKTAGALFPVTNVGRLALRSGLQGGAVQAAEGALGHYMGKKQVERGEEYDPKMSLLKGLLVPGYQAGRYMAHHSNPESPSTTAGSALKTGLGGAALGAGSGAASAALFEHILSRVGKV